MGCSNAHTRKVIILTKEPTRRHSSTIGSLNTKAPVVLDQSDLTAKQPFHQQEIPKIVETHRNVDSLNLGQGEEFGREGEDSEAKVIFKGKDKSNSIESNEVKRVLSRKLPPLPKHPLMKSDLDYSEMMKHKPNMKLIRDLLSKEEGDDLDEMLIEPGEIDIHNETILSILNELAVDVRS